MDLKLIFASLVIATTSGWALAQSAVTNEDAQQLVDTISGDQDKTQTYCDIAKLRDQIGQADQVGASTDELNQQMGKLDEKLGPEWSAFVTAYRGVELNTRAGLETAVVVQTTINALNTLCGFPARRRE